MNQDKKLVIINKEKIFEKDNNFYCDNVDIKSIAEGLSKNFKTSVIAKKSNIKRFHKINFENIDIASTVTDNIIIRESIENIKRGVFSGTDLSTLYKAEKIFPLTFSQLVKVGEKTGNIEKIYSSIAKYYEEDFDTAVARMSSMIEPIMIVFMGIVIGGMLIALYSPIFKVGELVGT